MSHSKKRWPFLGFFINVNLLCQFILSSTGNYYWQQTGTKGLRISTNNFKIPLKYEVWHLHVQVSPKLSLIITVLKWDLLPASP